MSNAITFQPNRMSMRYSAEKQSEEDLIKEDDETQYQEQNNAANGELHERDIYKEETFCDYMANICQCTSWLCANLVSSIVLCFENCIDFVHTCKCNTQCCCDVCGGSEDSVANEGKDSDNARFDDLSSKYEDEHMFEFVSPDVEESSPDTCVVVAENEAPNIDGEKLIDMSNNQNQAAEPENIESSSL